MPISAATSNALAPVMGIGAALLNKFLSVKTWTLINEDTKEVLQGQFPADTNSHDVEANWAEIPSLNRQHPVLQFLNGKADRLSIGARFYKRDMTDGAVEDKIEFLKRWTRRDQNKGRPPILMFALGDGKAVNMRVVLVGVTGITYSTPNFFGGVREVKFTMNFIQYTPFSLSDKQVTDTLYYRAKEGEYYELIAYKEYGNPMLGDVIRKHSYHRDKPLLKPGDIVRLPSYEGVRTQRVTQTSIPFAGAYSKKNTAQKSLRLEFFTARSKTQEVFLFDTPKASSIALLPRIFDETFAEEFG